MTLEQVAEILECTVLSGNDQLQTEVKIGCSSDLMSDVLAFSKPGCLLLTGLSNSQSVLTADVADVKAIVYVRGKRPDERTLKLAQTKKIPILATRNVMFEACGKLYEAGLQGVGKIL